MTDLFCGQVVWANLSPIGLPNHVELGGVEGLHETRSFAMTEQPRTIDRGRITGAAGQVDVGSMKAVRAWLCDWLDLAPQR